MAFPIKPGGPPPKSSGGKTFIRGGGGGAKSKPFGKAGSMSKGC